MSVQNKGAEIYFSWSIQVIAITAIVGILILGVVYKVLNDDVNIYIKVILSAFLSSVFVFFSIKTPISIQVKNGCLVVNQLLCKKRIAVSDIPTMIPRYIRVVISPEPMPWSEGGTAAMISMTLGPWNIARPIPVAMNATRMRRNSMR